MHITPFIVNNVDIEKYLISADTYRKTPIQSAFQLLMLTIVKFNNDRQLHYLTL